MRFRPQVAALAVAWDIISMDRAIEWLGLGPADLDRLRRLRQKPDRTRPSLASKLAALARPDMTASELAEAANRAGLPNSMSSIYKATKAHGIQLRKVQGNRTRGATRLGGKQKEGKYHV